MTLARTRQLTSKRKNRLNLWFERLMAIIILFNYLLILFDLSYIPYRDFWLQGKFQSVIQTPMFKLKFPEQPMKMMPFRVTDSYDWVKGVEANRETVQYLEKVDELKDLINPTFEQFSSVPQIEQTLADLRNLSDEMIKVNPFAMANKTGTLEKIKNRMRRHIFDTAKASADAAFKTFWSRDNLMKKGFSEELDFFDRDIRPLMETNYYRPVDENGKLLDNFIVLDFPFASLFLLEFLVRTLIIARRYTGVSWFDAMLWRWYDIFLFLPVFRWLRILPLIIRLNQAQLINLEEIQKQASQGLVASIAEDVTQVVIIRVINQVQNSIRQGDIQSFLQQRNREYIDLNNTNELTEIIKIVIQVTAQKVIPQIQPEAEDLLKYCLGKALDQTPIYKNIKQLPGFKNLDQQVSQRLAAQLYKAFSETLMEITKDDPKFSQLLAQLSINFSQTLGNELQSQYRINQIETLLVDFLEEFKINYVKRLSAEDVEMILEQARAMRQETEEVTLYETQPLHRLR